KPDGARRRPWAPPIDYRDNRRAAERWGQYWAPIGGQFCAPVDNLDLKQDDLSEELLAQIAADTGSYMGKFRDWLLIELNRANAKPKSTN
uniref:hypothetical protein n=1 Tax=Novosphingobium sp. HII-3 TaxID=2075565 RepID=UPI001E3B5A46